VQEKELGWRIDQSQEQKHKLRR